MYLSKNALKIFKNLSQNSQYLFLHALVYPVHRGYAAVHILCTFFKGIFLVPETEQLFFPWCHIRIFFDKVNFGFYKIGYSQHSTYFFFFLRAVPLLFPFFLLRLRVILVLAIVYNLHNALDLIRRNVGTNYISLTVNQRIHSVLFNSAFKVILIEIQKKSGNSSNHNTNQNQYNSVTSF